MIEFIGEQPGIKSICYLISNEQISRLAGCIKLAYETQDERMERFQIPDRVSNHWVGLAFYSCFHEVTGCFKDIEKTSENIHQILRLFGVCDFVYALRLDPELTFKLHTVDIEPEWLEAMLEGFEVSPERIKQILCEIAELRKASGVIRAYVGFPYYLCKDC